MPIPGIRQPTTLTSPAPEIRSDAANPPPFITGSELIDPILRHVTIGNAQTREEINTLLEQTKTPLINPVNNLGFEKVANDLTVKINALKIGERIWIPLTSEAFYLFERKKDGHFSLTIISAGSELHIYHSAIVEDDWVGFFPEDLAGRETKQKRTQRKSCSVTTYPHIQEKKLADPAALRSLLETKNHDSKSDAHPHTIQELFNVGAPTHLDANDYWYLYVKNALNTSEKERTNKTCHLAIAWLLKDDSSLATRFRFFAKWEELLDEVKTLVSQESPPALTNATNLKSKLENFLKRSRKDSDKIHLSNTEKEALEAEAQPLIQSLKDIIKEKKRVSETTLAVSPLIATAENVMRDVNTSEEDRFLQDIGSRSGDVTPPWETHRETIAPPIAAQQAAVSVMSHQFDLLPLTADNVLSELQRLEQWTTDLLNVFDEKHAALKRALEQCIYGQRIESIRDHLEREIFSCNLAMDLIGWQLLHNLRKLPIPGDVEGIWEAIPKTQVPGLLTTLERLSLLVSNVTTLGMRTKPAGFIESYTLLAIGIQVARPLDEDNFFNDYHLDVEPFEIFYNNFYARPLTQHEDHRRAEALFAYFQREKSRNSKRLFPAFEVKLSEVTSALLIKLLNFAEETWKGKEEKIPPTDLHGWLEHVRSREPYNGQLQLEYEKQLTSYIRKISSDIPLNYGYGQMGSQGNLSASPPWIKEELLQLFHHPKFQEMLNRKREEGITIHDRTYATILNNLFGDDLIKTIFGEKFIFDLEKIKMVRGFGDIYHYVQGKGLTYEDWKKCSLLRNIVGLTEDPHFSETYCQKPQEQTLLSILLCDEGTILPSHVVTLKHLSLGASVYSSRRLNDRNYHYNRYLSTNYSYSNFSIILRSFLPDDCPPNSYKGKYYLKWDGSSSRTHLLSQNGAIAEMEEDDERELNNTLLNPEDQACSTINYFKTLSTLDLPGRWWALTSRLLAPARILRQLRDSPRFAEKLFQFIEEKRIYHMHQVPPNWHLVQFFLELGSIVAHHVEKFQEENHLAFDVPDYRTIILEMIKTETAAGRFHNVEKLCCSLILAHCETNALYDNSRRGNALIDMAVARFHADHTLKHLFTNTVIRNDKLAEMQIVDGESVVRFLQEAKFELGNVLQEPHRQPFLTAVATRLDVPSEGPWREISFHTYTNGRTQLCFNNGVVTIDGHARTRTEIDDFEKAAEPFLEITGKIQNFSPTHSKEWIQCEAEQGTFYFKCSPLIPFIFQDRGFTDIYKKQNNSVYGLRSLSRAGQLQTIISAYTSEHVYPWLSSDQTHVVVETKKGGTYYYDTKNDTYYRTLPGGRKERLLSLETCEIDSTSNSRTTLIWIDLTSKKVRIEIPSIKLNFSYENGDIIWQMFDGFKLSRREDIAQTLIPKAAGLIQHQLMFDGVDGAEKVLLIDSMSGLHIYDVLENEEGRSLVSSHPTDLLFVAMGHLLEGNPKKAHAYMQVATPLQSFTQTELDIFGYFFRNFRGSSCPDLRSLALRLWTIVDEARVKFRQTGAQDEGFPSQVNLVVTLYDTYLQHLGKPHSYPLTIDEEKTLFRGVTRAYRQLQPRSSNWIETIKAHNNGLREGKSPYLLLLNLPFSIHHRAKILYRPEENYRVIALSPIANMMPILTHQVTPLITKGILFATHMFKGYKPSETFYDLLFWEKALSRNIALEPFPWKKWEEKSLEDYVRRNFVALYIQATSDNAQERDHLLILLITLSQRINMNEVDLLIHVVNATSKNKLSRKRIPSWLNPFATRFPTVEEIKTEIASYRQLEAQLKATNQSTNERINSFHHMRRNGMLADAFGWIMSEAYEFKGWVLLPVLQFRLKSRLKKFHQRMFRSHIGITSLVGNAAAAAKSVIGVVSGILYHLVRVYIKPWDISPISRERFIGTSHRMEPPRPIPAILEYRLRYEQTFKEMFEKYFVKKNGSSAESHVPLDTHYSLRKAFETFYQKKTPKEGTTWKTGIDSTTSFRQDLDNYHTEIKGRNKEFLDQLKSLRKKMIHNTFIQGKKKKISLTDMINLFVKGDRRPLKEMMKLEDLEIDQFEKGCASYIETKIIMQQIERIISATDQYDAANEAVLKETLLEEIAAEMLCPCFEETDPLIQRTFLVFELRNHLILRTHQVNFIRRFLAEKRPMDLVAQLSTGSGKSKVLGALLEFLTIMLNRQEAGTVFNMWPKPLYPVNKRDTSTQVAHTFGQGVETFEFTRDHGNGIDDDLAVTIRNLLKAKQEGKQLNTTPEFAQSFYLKFLEKLIELQEHPELIDSDALELIALYQEGMNFFEKCEVHMDESRENMRPKLEVNFTIGQPKQEPAESLRLMEETYRFLGTSKEMNDTLQIRDNRQHLVTKEEYLATVAPKVARHIWNMMISKTPLDEQTMAYLLDLKKSPPEWMKTHPHQNQIGLLRGQLHYLLVSALGGKVNAHFGLSQLAGGPLYAKPFSGNMCCVESRDLDFLPECYLKTLQIYFTRGLTKDEVWELIELLKNQFWEQQKSGIPLLENFAYRFYKKTLSPIFGVSTLEEVTRQHCRAAHDALHKNVEMILTYAHEVVAPTMKKYLHKLKSTPANLKTLFGNWFFFSATPGNKRMYGMKCKDHSDSVQGAQVLHAIYNKFLGRKVVQLAVTDPQQVLENVLHKQMTETTQMIADLGCLFTGIPNEAVARAIFSRFNGNKRVVFFSNDELMCLHSLESAPVLLNQGQIKPAEYANYVVYCDDKHIFGTDFTKLLPTAECVVTFDATTTIDSLKQAAGRLRKLLLKQSIVWVTTQKAWKQFRSSSSKEEILQLFFHASENEMAEIKIEVYQAIKQLMIAEVQSALTKKLQKATPRDAIRLMGSFKSLLVEITSEDYFEMWGYALVEGSALRDLKNLRTRLLSKVSSLKGLTKNEALAIQTTLNGYDLKSIAEFIPEKVLLNEFQLGIESQSEVEARVDVDRTVEVENFKVENTGKILRQTCPWAEDFDLFEGKWWNKLSSTADRISRVASLNFPTLFHALVRFDTFKYAAWSSVKLGVINMAAIYLGRQVTKSYPILRHGYLMGIPLLIITRIALAALKFAGGTILPLIGKKIGWITKEMPRLYDIKEVLKCHTQKAVGKASHVLAFENGSQVLMTNNFIKLRAQYFGGDGDVIVGTWGAPAAGATPLSNEQKIIHEMLVIQETLDDGSKRYTTIIGDDDTDGRFFRAKLREQSPHANPKCKICLYHITEGIVAEYRGVDGQFSDQELEEDPQFIKLLLAAKIYNGDIPSSFQQKEVLASMAAKPAGAKHLTTLYEASLTRFPQKRQRAAPILASLHQSCS